MDRIRLILLLLLINQALLANNEPLVFEAESAETGSDFQVTTDGAVTSVSPKTEAAASSFPGNSNKLLTFSIPFTEAGAYDLYVRIRVGAGGYNDDSFFAGKSFGRSSETDASSWHLLNGLVTNGYNNSGEIVASLGGAGLQTWKWLNVSEYLNPANPAVYLVPAANSKLIFQIGSRETGLEIDKIAFCKADYQYTVQQLDRVLPGTDPSAFYKTQNTFINPVLPGDHPDPSLFKAGEDFYASGSSFHFMPFGTILHSRDLVHWEYLSRVIPADWSGLWSAAPAAGVWGGTLSCFYNSWWYYFSNTAGGGQYFCRAQSPAGPWSAPVKVNTTDQTGAIGYDNSIFVDDDGTPYMLIKPAQFVNRIQKIGTDGHLTGPVIKMDWVNTGKKYSWAEGPVMCKRNGWYYYFIAGNVGGGQYVLRSRTLTSDSLSWQAMGAFFETITDGKVLFRSPNHITQPFMLADSSWWTLSHSYESSSTDSWDGQGRQGLLHPVLWDANGKPTGKSPVTTPVSLPVADSTGIPWLLPRSDEFTSAKLGLHWHFMNQFSARNYTLNTFGWLYLEPGNDSCQLLQKEARHSYTLSTRLHFAPQTWGQSAGILLTNGNQTTSLTLGIIAQNGRKIRLQFQDKYLDTPFSGGDTLWLKVERKEHLVSGYFSENGLNWELAGSFDVTELDKAQPGYNSWVGTSTGLFAKGLSAGFDCFYFRDGFNYLPLTAYENQYGTDAVTLSNVQAVTNASAFGGWFMLGGVQLGHKDLPATGAELAASSVSGGVLEIWTDNIQRNGTLLKRLEIPATGSSSSWKTLSFDIPPSLGQHDLFFRFSGGKNAFYLQSFRFTSSQSGVSVKPASQWNNTFYPNPFYNCFYLNNRTTVPYKICTLNAQRIEEGLAAPNQSLGGNLLPGVYLLTVGEGKHLRTHKIIKSIQ